MPRIWSWTIIRLALALAFGVAIGALYGHPALGGALVAVGIVLWQFERLYRLERWLATGQIDEIPDGEGVWPAVFAKIQYLRAKAKRRGKRFRRLVREMRASTEAFPDGGIILNSDHEILNFNQAAGTLLGLRGRRDRGQRIENLLRHPDFIDYLRDAASREFVEVPAPQKEDAWLLCRLIPYGPDQKLLLIRDVSQRVRLERMRRDFVANASHELRSPLTVITGYLDTLADDPQIPAAWRQPVATMQESTDRMRRLIDDLLQLSRLESGQPVGRERAVDVGALLSAARKEALGAPDAPRAVEISLDSQARLLGEELELQSVVSNLVSNAVRYTPPDGEVRIRWRADDSGGYLTVEDTGIGIAEADIPRITERFFRADGGRARERGGTGLGLAIVKHALRRHDAELEIRSQLGVGSTFTCRFPPERLAPG